MKKLLTFAFINLVLMEAEAQQSLDNTQLSVLDGKYISDDKPVSMFPIEYLSQGKTQSTNYEFRLVYSSQGIDRILVVNFSQSSGVLDKFYWRHNGTWCLVAEAERLTLITLVGMLRLTVNAHTEIDILSDKFIRQKTKKCDC